MVRTPDASEVSRLAMDPQAVMDAMYQWKLWCMEQLTETAVFHQDDRLLELLREALYSSSRTIFEIFGKVNQIHETSPGFTVRAEWLMVFAELARRYYNTAS